MQSHHVQSEGEQGHDVVSSRFRDDGTRSRTSCGGIRPAWRSAASFARMEAHYIQAKGGNKAAKELTTNLARLGPDYIQAKGQKKVRERSSH
jgi:hypothetical protein